jgi:sec-independent protein translocase protein TatB
MFDIGWTEMLVIAVVMIVVVGPKDLPKMLRTFGKTTTKLRSMAGDFQKQFNEALKEAELDDVKKSVDALRGLNPTNEIRKQLNPFEKAAADVRAGLDAALKPAPKPTPASANATLQTAEPLKNGATTVASPHDSFSSGGPAAGDAPGMPGVNGPDKMPEPPVMTPLAAASATVAASAPVVAPPKPTAKPRASRATAAKNGSADVAEVTKKPAKPRVRAKAPAEADKKTETSS